MPRRIRRIQVPEEFEPSMVSDNTVFIILDVYLYSSTVATLLDYGVEKVHPVYTEEGLDSYIEKGIPTGGESASHTDFTNSPQSVHAHFGQMDEVPKEVALNSHNGAKRTIECVNAIEQQNAESSEVFIGSPMNAGALASHIKENFDDHYVVLVSAGHEGNSTIEDVIGSVVISQYLRNEQVYKTEYKEILQMLPAGRIDSPEEFRWLSDEDIHHISQISNYNVVPKYDYEGEGIVDVSENK